MSELSVLMIGRLREMPSGFLAESDDVRFERVDHLDAAVRLLADAANAPELIVLSQSRPGQLSAGSIDALRRMAPLARIWRLLGSWCEGEPRSGQPPSGCLSTYWHQWPARWARDLQRVRDGNPPQWAAPVTLSADERQLAAAEVPIEQRAGRIVICARQAQTALALADACRLAGYSPLVVREGQQPSLADARAILWDADTERITDAAAIQSVRACSSAAPLVALVTFPRADDCRRALDAGVAAVLSKPFLIQDLFWHLDRVAG